MTFDSLILWLESIGPIKAALVATTFTWALTAAGASLVFFFKSNDKSVNNSTRLCLSALWQRSVTTAIVNQ